MINAKGALSSITIWGGLLTLIPQAADLLGQVAAVPGVPPHISGPLVTVGGLLAILGRLVAKKKIKGII